MWSMDLNNSYGLEVATRWMQGIRKRGKGGEGKVDVMMEMRQRQVMSPQLFNDKTVGQFGVKGK